MNSQPFLENKHKSTLHISLMAWNIALSSFYFGFCIVYLGSLPFDTIFEAYHIDVNKGVAQGLLNGCIPVGALIGSLGSSLIISRFSRRKNLLMTNLMAFFLGILIYIPNYYSLLVFRLGQGICVGIYSVLAPLIIRQLSPVTLSGRFGTFVQVNITLGLLTSYFVTYILKQITGDLEGQSFWHLLFAIPQPVILIQTIILIFVFPYETPKYLLLKGQESKAIQLLQLIYKKEYVQQILQEKKNDIIHFEALTKNQESTLSENDSPSTKRSNLAIIMAIHIASMQQMSGVNAFNVYTGPILNKAVTPQLAMLIPTLMSLQKLITTFITTCLISKFGRKFILQGGVLFTAISSGLVAVGFMMQDEYNSSSSSILIIIGFFVFMASFGLTLGPVTWVYIAETVEPKTIPYAIASNWIAASTVIILFPIIKENILGGDPGLLFLFFTCWSFGSFIINRFFLLQTKDKTQQQIREEYLNYKVC